MSSLQTRLLVHTFPYPASRALCAIDAVSDRAPQRKLQVTFHALEVLLHLLGSAVIQEALEERTEGVVAALKRLHRSPHLSLGMWGYVLTELASSLRSPFLQDLAVLARDTEYQSCLDRLVTARNELLHPVREVESGEARQYLTRLSPDLDALVEWYSFLGRFHLLGVHEEPRSNGPARKVRAIVMRGRSLHDNDVTLSMEGNVHSRDVLLIDPSVERGLILNPFLLLTPESSSGDVLFLSREQEPKRDLSYYPIERPGHSVTEPPLSDQDSRAQGVWAWLFDSHRPTQRIQVLPSKSGKRADLSYLRGLAEASADLPLGEIRHLRSGGMSEVFTGRDPASGIVRVLKTPKNHDDRSVRKHFFHEYASLSAVSHPGVIKVFNVQEVDNVGPCIVEEFFDHPSVQECMDQGSFDLDEALELALLILDAVAALHKMNIVHRDLKGSNILYDRSGRSVRVIDLGIARRLDATSNPTTRFGQGTPGAMAPEQTEGGSTTPATDVYALGLLTRSLFERVEDGAAAEGRAHAEESRAAVDAVIARATAHDPLQRYQDAFAMREALSRTSVSAACAVSLPKVEAKNASTVSGETSVVLDEVRGVFEVAIRRVRDIKKGVGFTTAPDQVRKELDQVLQDLRLELVTVLNSSEIPLLAHVSDAIQPGDASPLEEGIFQFLVSKTAMMGSPPSGMLAAAGAFTLGVTARRDALLETCARVETTLAVGLEQVRTLLSRR